MITENTVLILGAGSNVPYGFPTMRQLRQHIVRGFRDYYINNFTTNRDENDVKIFLRSIDRFISRFNSSTLMIDEFLSDPDNADVRKIGKLAIICAIADFERQSTFREESKDPNSDWYTSFFQQLYRDLPDGEKYKLWNHNFKVITFNYDRSFEHFLYDSLIGAHFNRIDEIKDGMNEIEIIHVYGRMARLEWQHDTTYDKDPLYISYGNVKSGDQHDRCSDNIEIMFTTRLKNDRIKKIKEIIIDANKILFIGFGFDEYNLNNLGITEDIQELNQDLIWNQYKMDEPQKEFVKGILKPDGNKRIIVDGNAKELIDNHLL